MELGLGKFGNVGVAVAPRRVGVAVGTWGVGDGVAVAVAVAVGVMVGSFVGVAVGTAVGGGGVGDGSAVGDGTPPPPLLPRITTSAATNPAPAASSRMPMIASTVPAPLPLSPGGRRGGAATPRGTRAVGWRRADAPDGGCAPTIAG